VVKLNLNKKEADIDPDSISMDNSASDDEIARFSNFLTEGKTIPKAPALA
jgi:hypothetical protein